MMIRRLSFPLKVFVAPSSWFGVGARVDLPLLLQQVLTPFPLAAYHKYYICEYKYKAVTNTNHVFASFPLAAHHKYYANTNTNHVFASLSINYYQLHREIQNNHELSPRFDKRVRLHSSVVPRHVGWIF